MTWRIEPGTNRLVSDDDDRCRFTPAEFRNQQWPPCPLCGAEVWVQPLDVTQLDDGLTPHYMAGRWECENGCDPRQAG